MRTVFATSVACMFMVLRPPQARAEPARDVVVEVHAPPDADCVTAERLRAQVEERVGSIVFLDAQYAERHVDVRIAAGKGAGFSAAILLRDAQGRSLGERDVHSDSTSCGELEPSLVLVISTLIGMAQDTPPVAVVKTDQPQPDEVQAPADDTSAEPNAVREPAAPVPTFTSSLAPAQRGFRFGLALLGELHSGLLPGVTPVASLALFARRDWLELRFAVNAAPWSARDLGGAAETNFRALLGYLDLCGVAVTSASGDVAFCAGAQAGAIRAESTGLYENKTTVRPVMQLTLRASLQVPVLQKHALLFGVGAGLPVVSQTYRFVERDEEERRIHAVELGLFAEIGWLWQLSS